MVPQITKICPEKTDSTVNLIEAVEGTEPKQIGIMFQYLMTLTVKNELHRRSRGNSLKDCVMLLS